MTEPHVELLRAMQRVCVERRPREEDLSALANRATPAERFTLYRELVRSRLRDLIAAAYPRTTAAIERSAMDALADAFLESAPPRTRFFREHAESFATWAIPRLGRAEYPLWCPDLMRLEAARWQANYRENDRPADSTDFDLEAIPVPSATLVAMTVRFAVHREHESPPSAGTFHLAVYRRPDHRVETRWMEPLWASLLVRMSEAARPAIEDVRAVLTEHDRVADAAFVDELTTFLALLVDNGALLGSRRR